MPKMAAFGENTVILGLPAAHTPQNRGGTDRVARPYIRVSGSHKWPRRRSERPLNYCYPVIL